MAFGVGLIAVLLAVGGFAAYLGDQVGRLAGRRRLSLFNLRPRYTSRLITIFTGILIVSITLITLLLASANVRQALFGLEKLQSTVAVLSQDVENKNDDLIRLEAQKQHLTVDIGKLTLDIGRWQQENRSLQAQNQKWKKANESLAAENGRLSAARLQLEKERSLLEQSTQLLRALGSDYYTKVGQLRQAEIAYQRGEVLGSKALDTTRPLAELQAQLHQLIADTARKITAAGRASGLRVEVSIPAQGTLGTDVLVEAAANSIKDDPALQSVIVQLRAQANTATGEDVFADFQLIRNVKIYDAGDIVLQRRFDGRTDKALLFEEFYLFITAGLRSAVIGKGLLPADDMTYGGVSVREAYQIVDQIAASAGPVELLVVAAEECWTAGPLELLFQLRRPAG